MGWYTPSRIRGLWFCLHVFTTNVVPNVQRCSEVEKYEGRERRRLVQNLACVSVFGKWRKLNKSTVYGVYWSSSPQKGRFGINHNLPMFTKFCVKSWWLPKTLHLRQYIHRVHVHLWGFSRMASPRLVGMEKWWKMNKSTGGNPGFPMFSAIFLRPKWIQMGWYPNWPRSNLSAARHHATDWPGGSSFADPRARRPGLQGHPRMESRSNCGVSVRHVNPCYESPRKMHLKIYKICSKGRNQMKSGRFW